jgi:hypothetical protein
MAVLVEVLEVEVVEAVLEVVDKEHNCFLIGQFL